MVKYGIVSRGGEMVYARALRALECITHAGPSPALGTTTLKLRGAQQLQGICVVALRSLGEVGLLYVLRIHTQTFK